MITSRRTFLRGMGSSLLATGLGTTLAGRLGTVLPLSDDELAALTFGELEPLVELMQETHPDELQPILIGKLRSKEADLRTLVCAAALANARSFGGENYVGYHCLMALTPAYDMAMRLPEARAPLPVLKVIHRNTDEIVKNGGRSGEVLRTAPEATAGDRRDDLERLRQAVIACDANAAERAFAALSKNGKQAAYDDLQHIVQEDINVHRVVLAWRAWEVLPFTGDEHASTMMRQSVRFCVDEEQHRRDRGLPEPELRTLLPALLEDCELASKPAGSRRATNEELEELGLVVFCGERREAATAMAKALAGGLSHQDAGEALTLAANHLLIHDPGRKDDAPGKPRGSVHGASTGVHASDAARAWRNIAAVTDQRNAAASLIGGAYHTAGQSHRVGKKPVPYRDLKGEFESDDEAMLLRRTSAAIEERDQKCAMAAVECYCERGGDERPLFDLLLGYAVTQDGALHAEKYYGTICEEYATARPAFQTRHLVALARVTASEHGWPAPGVEAAQAELGT